MSANPLPKATGRHRPRRWALVIVSLSLMVLGMLSYWHWGLAGPQPPEIDMAGFDPETAEAIREARTEVCRHPRSGASRYAAR